MTFIEPLQFEIGIIFQFLAAANLGNKNWRLKNGMNLY
jgi:hypothetical protein